MNAVARAENRPAYHSTKHTLINTSRRTHKDQDCVQVLFPVLQEFFVILFSYLVVVLVELGLVVRLSGQFILVQAARWRQQSFGQV